MTDTNFLFNVRVTLGLSTTEAGQLVGVTKRTWELWEAGKNRVPSSRLELMRHKLEGYRPSERELLVVVSEDNQRPIDVIANDTFLSLQALGVDGLYCISSLAIDVVTNRPYVKRQRFHQNFNQHVISTANKWKSILID